MRRYRRGTPMSYAPSRTHLQLLGGAAARQAPAVTVLSRGVHLLPWAGPCGGPVLVAITSEGRALEGTPLTVPAAREALAASEALWDRLDRENPQATVTSAGGPS